MPQIAQTAQTVSLLCHLRHLWREDSEVRGARRSAATPEWSRRGLGPNRALILAHKAVRLEPTNASYLNTLGVAYYRAGQFTNAVETLLKASRLNASAENAYAPESDFFFLAMSYHQLGDTTKAKEYYQQALQAWGKHAEPDADTKSFRQATETLLGIPTAR